MITLTTLVMLFAIAVTAYILLVCIDVVYTNITARYEREKVWFSSEIVPYVLLAVFSWLYVLIKWKIVIVE